MSFRKKLLAFGSLLVLVSIGAIVLLYSWRMYGSLSESAEKLLLTKLDLLENRVASSHAVLERAGIADNDFYAGTARDSIASSFASVMGQGEFLLFLGLDGRILAGPEALGGSGLAERDPLRLLLAAAAKPGTDSGPGVRLIRSPALYQGAEILVAARRFEPWSMVLAVGAKRSVAFAPLDRALNLSLALSSVLLAAALAAIFLFAGRMSEPLVRLASLAKELGEGRRGLSTEVSGRDEIALLARQFNDMARKIDALTVGLEARVEERTLELTSANQRLTELNDDLAAALSRAETMQGQLVESEKLVALGHLVAGIAHELNTPLGAISMASRSLREILEDLAAHVERLSSLSPEAREEMLEAVASFDRSPILSRAQKAEALSRLAKGLAEGGVRNADRVADLLYEAGFHADRIPAALVEGEAQDMAMSLYELSGLARSAEVIATASQQAIRVIEALRTYARQDLEFEFVPVRLDASLDQVLTLFASKIKLGISVNRDYEPMPPVMASAEKLAQVWTNLIANALQAMDYKGNLGISARSVNGQAVVEIRDSGPGIPAEARPHIFKPFFTTKPPGEGTGLGLEISRRIVETFGGGIGFETGPDGTVFRVSLPLPPG